MNILDSFVFLTDTLYPLLYVHVIKTINATLWGTNLMSSCERYFYVTYIESMKSQNSTRWEQVTMVTMLLQNMDFPSEWVFYTCSLRYMH